MIDRYFTVTATSTKEGSFPVRLTFVDEDIASQTARELRRLGYDAAYDRTPFTIHRSVESAVEIATLFLKGA